MQFFFRIFVLLLVCFLSLVTPVTNASTNDQPLPSSARKISVPGIHNAGKINEHLYRGSQPKLAELSQLKKLGVTTIIDLRAESPQTAKEERLSKLHGKNLESEKGKGSDQRGCRHS